MAVSGLKPAGLLEYHRRKWGKVSGINSLQKSKEALNKIQPPPAPSTELKAQQRRARRCRSNKERAQTFKPPANRFQTLTSPKPFAMTLSSPPKVVRMGDPYKRRLSTLDPEGRRRTFFDRPSSASHPAVHAVNPPPTSSTNSSLRRLLSRTWQDLSEHLAEMLYIPYYRPEWREREFLRSKPKPKDADTRLLIRSAAAAATSKYKSSSRARSKSLFSETVSAYTAERQLRRFLKLESEIQEHQHNSSDSSSPFPHDHENCLRVRINVSGRIFETQRRTLMRYPKTLLGDVTRMDAFYDPTASSYYFDRNADNFESVLYYFQSGGRYWRPLNVPVAISYSDIFFYDLGNKVLQQFRRDEGILIPESPPLPPNLFKRKLWLLMDDSTSSPQATAIGLLSAFTVIFSIVNLCLETVDDVHDSSHESDQILDLFFVLDVTVCSWFTFELFVRAFACPDFFAFCKSWMNWMDFIAILPTLIEVFAFYVPGRVFQHVHAIKVIRVFRVTRVFKLSKHHRGLEILGRTLRSSVYELFLLLFFMGISVLLFSSAMYFSELDENGEQFSSIPKAFYWGITTIATAGYGDIVPKTTMGKLIGSVTAVAAVLTLAMPVPLIVSNFNYFYRMFTKENTNLLSENPTVMCPHLPSGGEGARVDQKVLRFEKVK